MSGIIRDDSQRTYLQLVSKMGIQTRPLLEAVRFKLFTTDTDRYTVAETITDGTYASTAGSNKTNVARLNYIQRSKTYDTTPIDLAWETKYNRKSPEQTQKAQEDIADRLYRVHDGAMINGLGMDAGGVKLRLEDRNLVYYSHKVQSVGGTGTGWAGASIVDIKNDINAGFDFASTDTGNGDRTFNTIYMSESAWRTAGTANAGSDGQMFQNWLATLNEVGGINVVLDPLLNNVLDTDGVTSLGKCVFMFNNNEILGYGGGIPQFADRSGSIKHDAIIGELVAGGIHKVANTDTPIYLITNC